MNSHARPSFPRRLPRLPLAILPALALILVCATLSALHAQTAAKPGSITGRVFNPAADEYVRDAQIRNAATGETVFTAAGGFYEMFGLPVGEATIVLSYAGLPDVARTVTITAGATATLNFELPLPTGPTTAATTDDVVQLEKFTVTSEREGQAKVIMRERASLDIGTSVSSDLFGSDPEGNIGEFLRNMPGIIVNSTAGEATSASIGGLPSEYTNVTVDGVSTTVANMANSTRSATFELISLNSMESIEISRTISADVDANAPAGTINLRSKSAFDRRGVHFATRIVLNAHSSALNFDKTLGPDDDRRSLKIRPGFLASFSVARRGKFGLLVDLSESNIYSVTNDTVIDINFSPNTNDPRPQVPAAITFRQTPRVNHRFASTIRADWRVTPALSLGASLNYSVSDLWHRQRNLVLATSVGANYADRPANSLAIVAGDNPMQAFEVAGGSNSYVSSESRNVVQSGRYVSPEVRLEYKTRNLAIDARVGYADSKSAGDSYGKKGAAYIVRGRATGVAYRVTRSPGTAAADYTITQLGGPDLADGASYTGDRVIYMEDGRKTTAKVLNAQANVSLMTRWLWPIHWKTGLKSREEKRTFDENVYLSQWAYTANASHAGFKSPYDFDFGRSGASLATTGGGTVWTPDTSAIADAYRADADLDPSDKLFSKVTTADQYYQARVLYHRNFLERIDAGYLMATTTFLNKRISARAGLRYENTTNQIREADSYTSQQVIDYVTSLPAAEQLPYRQGGTPTGAIVNASGRAITIPGIDYQFLSRPWIRKDSDYARLFPSASLKYNILSNLNLQLGFSTTIRRPNYGDLIGVTLVDTTNSLINIANKRLQPEKARNLAARLAWYPKGAGAISIALYQNNVQNKIQSNLISVADYADPALANEYPGYMVSSRFNSAAGVTIRSMELAWRRNLGFIAPALRPITLRASWTRTYAEILQPAADERHVSGLVPHTVNAGLSYAHRGVSLNINWNWNDTYPFSTTGLSLNRHRSRTDLSGDYRINRHYTVSFSIRNLFDDPYVELKDIAPGPLVMSRYMRTGSVISLSVKGEW